MRQEKSGETPVTDHPAMGAGIAETGHRVRVQQHLTAHLEIEIGVVEEGTIQERLPFLFQ